MPNQLNVTCAGLATAQSEADRLEVSKSQGGSSVSDIATVDGEDATEAFT
jgi:hypothetical protein